MLRLWPLLGATVLLAALTLACDGGNGSSSTPTAGETPSGEQTSTPAPTAMTFSERPEITIDPAKKYVAVVEMEKGTFRIALNPELALQTVNSFVFLARQGYYNSATFHSVLPGFVAQGGDPTGTGSGGPGYTLPDEFSDTQFERGTVGMARGEAPNSGGSQFFIAYAAMAYDDVDGSGDVSVDDKRLRVIGPYAEGSAVAEGDTDIGNGLTTVSHLNGLYTVFGKVVEGMEVVDALTPRDPEADPTAPPGDAIISIEILEE